MMAVEVLVSVLLLSIAVLGFSALQLRAISATDESLVRTQAMSVIRGLAENMRANASELDTYEDTINTLSTTNNDCNTLSDSCTAKDMAITQSQAVIKKLEAYDINIAIVKCPGTAGFSEIKCVMASWGDTDAVMDDGDTNSRACAKADGTYKSGSTCVIIETY